MLGVDCGWGYIHPVKFTQSSNIADKRIGELIMRRRRRRRKRRRRRRKMVGRR